MDDKVIKSHGMSSEKASRVKIRGHKKEHIYASLIGGKVIQGTKKEDVVDSQGRIHSLKGGGEMKGGEGRKGKWQIFLHKLSKFEEDNSFYGREIFIKILKAYPQEYKKYESNKKYFKMKIIPYMKKLKEFLSIDDNKYNFLNKAFFDERVDYFVIYHDDAFYIYDRLEAIKAFTKYLLIENNSTFQKVVLKYRDLIIGEIEVRTTNDGKYPSILFNMLKLRALNLLIEKIMPVKKLNPFIYAYGEAIKTFNL